MVARQPLSSPEKENNLGSQQFGYSLPSANKTAFKPSQGGRRGTHSVGNYVVKTASNRKLLGTVASEVTISTSTLMPTSATASKASSALQQAFTGGQLTSLLISNGLPSSLTLLGVTSTSIPTTQTSQDSGEGSSPSGASPAGLLGVNPKCPLQAVMAAGVAAATEEEEEDEEVALPVL
ncbi:hypothetical protein CEUSTIGMA_g9869.t1 [Chlamydomonas eustigma]|uniref:Uncharacterized protein n=1 Tax=Chlamydomonas eustigma TaxID=1157962 RepID=A0A250XH85_9CHLO|nr:hypothetical protein CEUSTIGMA_g9869.t1 [Chlamydomonas eustigma]|eukprot:GAX82441.1 hypothetical protein CEUSTIGMA_g9869.t1 [Chlamydomonas eustigma]